MGSVDTSLSDLVTIIVKAPNQQIADQTIKCHLNWSIKKLKDYLSQVYPSKPKLEEQKLIYSGKLLTDSAILKDILRTYEGQENHTVHLVCATKMNSQKTVKKTTPRPDSSDSESSYNGNTQANNRENDRSHSSASPNTPSFPVTAPSAPFFGQMNANQLPSLSNFDPRFVWPSANTFGGFNDGNVNHQFAMMQQAYAQYISQYMQMMGQPGLGYMTSHLPNSYSRTASQPTGNLFNNINNPNHQNLPQVRPPVIEEDAPNGPAQGVGAVGNDVDDDENRNNRDWLDWFYVLSRLVVLFSVVYFYSTPLRLLAVLLLLCMFYLHQNMRIQNDHLNANNNNNDNNIVNNNNQNNNVNNRENDDRPVAPPPAPPAQQPDANDQPPETNASRPAAPTAPVPERLSPIAVTVLAIRTFFLSLVPDQPMV